MEGGGSHLLATLISVGPRGACRWWCGPPSPGCGGPGGSRGAPSPGSRTPGPPAGPWTGCPGTRPPQGQQVLLRLEQEGGAASQGVGEALAGAVEDGLVIALQGRLVVALEEALLPWQATVTPSYPYTFQ